MSRKLIVIGLDCATPQLVFDAYRDELPNIVRLMTEGIYTELVSSIPPITVPAWSCMLTGKDPGQLGFYGFRNRADYSYEKMTIANAGMIKEKRVWDRLSQKGKKSIVIGVPQTYPVSKINGLMVSGFLTPGIDSNYTYPDKLKEEIKNVVGEYIIDVKDFRTDNKQWLLDYIYRMTEKRFDLAKYLIKNKEWDYFMMVEMGPDRIHHGFWRFCDQSHSKYQPGNGYENAIKEYYMYLDAQIGQILNLVDENTSVMIVSDHGAKGMKGGICINDWLIKKGYLTVKQYPQEITLLYNENIDWTNTKVWASGGYYGRIFFNVKYREPNGIIAESDYVPFRNMIKNELEEMSDPDGGILNTKVYIPQEIYKEVRNIAPDLIALFGDLEWRSVGSIGYKNFYTYDNDTGPDDANHARNGIFILKAPGLKKKGCIEKLNITDCAGIMMGLMED